MTLRRATFTNFTAIPSASFDFSENINIIVGDNGTGKSHVLKAVYSLLKIQATRFTMPGQRDVPPKSVLEREIASILVENFRAEYLGRLVKRRQGRSRCELHLDFQNARSNLRIAFATNARTAVEISKAHTQLLEKQPVMLPTRELITLSPWFLGLYDNLDIEFEGSWRDTVSLLAAPALRGARDEKVHNLIVALEEAMGGRVEIDQRTGKFYLRTGQGRMEMPLVAEGLRKFAMVARLISTGILLDRGYLFWDEPEANLNPRLVRTCAKVIQELASLGVQVFVATHSLFLLKELEMLTPEGADGVVRSRFFSLHIDGTGEHRLAHSDELSDLEPLVSLDEEISQSERFLSGDFS
jgi:predicted ATPase